MDRTPARHELHLWQIVWVRDIVWLLVAALILLAAYATRAIIVPILIGLALAYVFNPFVTAMHRRHRWPRWATTAALVTVTFGSIAVAVAATMPGIISQGRQLFDRVGHYAVVLSERLEEQIPTEPTIDQNPIDAGNGDETPGEPEATPPPPAGQNAPADATPESTGKRSVTSSLTARASQQLANLEPAAVANFVIRSLDIGVGVVGSVISFAAYLILAAVVVTLCFFFFSWHFGPVVEWFGTFIPEAHRPRTLHILGRMDRSVSAFIRGRLIQSLVMIVLLSIGWKLFDVPYWLLLGVLTGLLNLVPYAGMIGFLLAASIAVIDQLTGAAGQASATFNFWVPLGVAIVYLIAQGIDGWVVEPMVQGKATELDPLTILLVVLIGGSLAGLLGLLLAIPIAACTKILAQEVILPRLRSRV